MKKFDTVNQDIKALLFSSKELDDNFKISRQLIEQDLENKIKSALEHM